MKAVVFLILSFNGVNAGMSVRPSGQACVDHLIE